MHAVFANGLSEVHDSEECLDMLNAMNFCDFITVDKRGLPPKQLVEPYGMIGLST